VSLHSEETTATLEANHVTVAGWLFGLAYEKRNIPWFRDSDESSQSQVSEAARWGFFAFFAVEKKEKVSLHYINF